MNTPDTAGLLWDGNILRRTGNDLRAEIGLGYKVGLAVKSFPLREGLALLCPQVDFFDLSNFHEYELIEDQCRPDQELWLTNCPESDVMRIAARHTNVFWNVSETAELRRARQVSRVAMSLRIDTTSFLNEDQKGYIRSRFGLMPDELAALSSEEKGAVSALHFHHSFEAKGDDLFVQLFDRVVALLGLFPAGNIQRLNLGGGWGRVSSESWRWARSRTPSSITLMIEPGRRWTQHAGWAFSSIDRIVTKSNGLIFLEGILSPGAHLRWAFPGDVTLVRRGQDPKRLEGSFFWASRTCWEGDRLHLFDGCREIAIGDTIVFSGVPGYALAWNHSFNGIPTLPARIV